MNNTPCGDIDYNLTDLELVVLEMSAHGLKPQEIAPVVGYCERYTRTLLSNVFDKLNARNTAHAVFLACRHRVIDIDCDAALLEVSG